MSNANKLASLGIKVEAEDGIATMKMLADAVERVNKALDDLNGKQFERIEITVVGQLAKVEVTAKVA